MFSYTSSRDFKAQRFLGGAGLTDNHSYRILSAGPSPEDNTNILVKKVFKTGEKQYFIEQTTFDPSGKTVHSIVSSLGHLDIAEDISHREDQIRKQYRVMPSVASYSLFWKQSAGTGNFFSLTEGVHNKNFMSFTEKINNYFLRRDAFAYLKNRWVFN